MFNQREMDLISYLPDYLRGILEFNEIGGVEKKELTQLYSNIGVLWNNGFIVSSDYQGIKRWEALLGIKADAALSLEERRNIVLANWNYQLPYTQRKLQEQLTSLLGDSYEFYVDNRKSDLKIVVKECPLVIVESIRNMVGKIIPANLEAEYYSKYQGNYNPNKSFFNSITIRTAFFPRYNLAHLNLDRNWTLNGISKLNGYNDESPIDFYPTGNRFCAEIQQLYKGEEQLHIFVGIPKQLFLEDEVIKVQAELKNDSVIKETISYSFKAMEYMTAGPVCITNRNVLENEWVLDGNRDLNGGLTIL
ncbi:MAG: hypothetical protein K0R23_1075 [Lacrimispora sp.]|nr:hypothetical protein [Lacrimispora sp.]